MEAVQDLATSLLSNKEQIKVAASQSITDFGISVNTMAKASDTERLVKSANSFKKVENTISKTEKHITELTKILNEHEITVNQIHRSTRDIECILSIMEALSMRTQQINKDIIEARDLALP